MRRASPSMIVLRLVGAPTSLSSEMTATGSVGERMVPTIQHTLKFHSRLNMKMTAPVSREAMNTPTNARSSTCTGQWSPALMNRGKFGIHRKRR